MVKNETLKTIRKTPKAATQKKENFTKGNF